MDILEGMYVYMYVCVCLYMDILEGMYVYVCMYVCVFVYGHTGGYDW